jgi:hypothetical protein
MMVSQISKRVYFGKMLVSLGGKAKSRPVLLSEKYEKRGEKRGKM